MKLLALLKTIDCTRLVEYEEVFNSDDPQATPLYHGSDSAYFTNYDMSQASTASDIYTTVNPQGAEGFGKYLYRVYPNNGLKYLDLSPFGEMDYKGLQALYVEMDIEEDHEMSIQEFEELMTSGRVYDKDFKGRFQDQLMTNIQFMGYDALIWVDAGLGNIFMDTVVFFDSVNVTFERIVRNEQERAELTQLKAKIEQEEELRLKRKAEQDEFKRVEREEYEQAERNMA